MSLPETLHPTPLILDLTAPENDLESAGGKGANLGAMLHAGLPVPPGFCVTTSAYGRVTELSEAGAILEALAAVPAGNQAELSRLAERMRELVAATTLPQELERAIVEAYDSLGKDVPVAVRSSATAEDLPTASFAGQQDTYLGIVGHADLLSAVRRCWASLWNERAVSYRAANRIDPRGVRLAVVVQRMVDAQVAGVLFTANPLTGSRHQAVVDASPGLGEAVVSGAVNPDHFTIDRVSGEVLEHRLGDKRVVIRQVAGGGTVREELASSAQAACLGDPQLRELATLGGRVEGLFGSPQDIEFAFDGAGVLWLTQARPITTLFPVPDGAMGQALRVYFSLNVFQGMFQPFTPMGLQSFRLLTAGAASLAGYPVADPLRGATFFGVAAQRIYADFTDVLRNPLGRRILLFALAHMEARSVPVLERLVAERPELALRSGLGGSALRGILRVMARTGVPARVAWALRHPQRAIERADRCLYGPIETVASDPLEVLQELMTGTIVRFLDVAPSAVGGILAGAVARKLLGGLATSQELDTVRRALPNNPTTEMDLALWALSRRIHRDPEARRALEILEPAELTVRYQQDRLPSALQEGMAGFLERYGQRGLAEIDMGTARWSDDPTYLFGVLANYLRMDEASLAPDALFARGRDGQGNEA